MAVYHYIRLQAAERALPFKKRGKGSYKTANFAFNGRRLWRGSLAAAPRCSISVIWKKRALMNVFDRMLISKC